MNFSYLLGFGLVSGVVKVPLVSSLFLARKSTRNNGGGMGSQIGHVTSRRGKTFTCT